MSQDTLVKMKSTKSKHILWTRRKKNASSIQWREKLEFVKFDPTIRKRVLFKQTKK